MDDLALMCASLVRNVLGADDVEALIGGRLYDGSPPEDVKFPYVTLGRPEGGADGQATVTFHIWSRHGGRAEALDVIAAMRAAIHQKPVTFDAKGEGEGWAQFADVFRSGDGRTTHGVLRIRVFQKEQA